MAFCKPCERDGVKVRNGKQVAKDCSDCTAAKLTLIKKEDGSPFFDIETAKKACECFGSDPNRHLAFLKGVPEENLMPKPSIDLAKMAEQERELEYERQKCQTKITDVDD